MQERLVAGIDLGANSFHMVVARLMDQELVPIDSIAEKVQLIAGVDEHRVLSEEAILRGLSCLQRFKERIKNIPADSVRIVGTSTLRISKNSKTFITRAEQLLGLPIAVVSGHEEARLIYLGIAHTQKSETGKRFVIDIGGGSTEFIIGSGFTPSHAMQYCTALHHIIHCEPSRFFILAFDKRFCYHRLANRNSRTTYCFEYHLLCQLVDHL